MELEIAQNKISKALNVVSRVAMGSRTTLPILSNVLIKSNEGKVSLVTTNLDMAVVDYLPIKSDSDGSVTVPAKLLADFVSNLPKNENVKIKTSGTKVVISAGKYQSSINGTKADDFPELPEINEKNMTKFVISVDEFKNNINQIIIASSNDMTRPALTGVYFNTFEGSLFVAATDGYRLAERKFINKVESEVSAIVPSSSLQEVMRSINDEIDEIEILFDEAQVVFRLGEIEITSKLIEGRFPDYRQLIPKDNEVVLLIKKDELLRITKLAALFAREVGGSINLESNKEQSYFSVASIANEYGENDSKIEMKIEEDGKITLNSKFLIDAINALEEDEVRLEFSSRLTPIVIKNSKSQNYIHIVMPLKS